MDPLITNTAPITPTMLVPYSAPGSALFGADGLSFKDVLDSVNPLQQLPIVGSVYRSATGDSISTASRLAGGAILGGPVGLALAAATSLVEAMTGNDPVGHLVAAADISAPPEKYVMKAYSATQALV